MCAAAVQIIAPALVLDHVQEAVVADVLAVPEGVQQLVHLVALEVVLELALEAVLAAVQVDVPEVVRAHVLTHVRVVLEDVWAIAQEHALEHVQELVPLLAQVGIIINLDIQEYVRNKKRR